DESSSMPNVLDEIIQRKRREVEEAKSRVPLEAMRRRALEADRPRNFFRAVTDHATARSMAVIAEIKRKSPSSGWLRPEYASDEFDPVPIAKAYHRAGAAALSVLTDAEGFGGDI